ncbi:MAG: hypothetical protein Q9M40_02345 [Sulfurimonas sp.]|nr:hypothetical protein [Sulfurimonas sp.]
MSKLSKTKIIKIFTTLLILLIIAKLLSLILFLYITSDGVELNAKRSYKAKYQRVDCHNMLLVREESLKQTKQSVPTYNIDSLLLKGLYGSRFNGYAIVAKKSSPKTTIVAVGEEFAGYKLKEIFMDYVVFTKAKKEYTLSLKKSNTE